MRSPSVTLILSSFFFNDPAPTEIYPLSLPDALPIFKFFECRGSFISDELADETLNRLARKIDEGEEIEKNVFAFSLGIARFVLLETLKSPDNRRVEMKEMALGAAAPEPWEEDDDLWIA